ncbi:MAG: aminotransferase class V-fold PLP-dependent enzyme [Candidatus Liptonbacteria bacterium]|nr:aminotransferase class V-fold PLP-dependent enzyme [Candidatus Liptonbacteria bacterium]
MAHRFVGENQLEKYFDPFRRHIVGHDAHFAGPYGRKKIVYADWTASGRFYAPIERKIIEQFGPLVGSTHTEETVTGSVMTEAYREAKEIIKRHVRAGPRDVLLATGSGMTGAVCKFQRILGLRVPEQYRRGMKLRGRKKPVVFVTHLEHHSNHTTWIESIADVECIRPDREGYVDLDHLQALLARYKNRETKIAAVSACSNVTGICTRYHKIAKVMHANNGLCFVDFAASAPYVDIHMHPKDSAEKLDAIYFSPHKFLGGPGTPGILIFDSRLYQNRIPDQPGGGTVVWTNPWGRQRYFSDIEQREDGGTPPFLGTIKAALSVRLKEEMGIGHLMAREKELVGMLFRGLRRIPGLTILAGDVRDRLGIFSFCIDGLHYNLGTALLNDRFGVQTRSGCACAGTYGHYLFHISMKKSKTITDRLDRGDWSLKPGFIRISVHPTMTDREVRYIIESVRSVAEHFRTWRGEYRYDKRTNVFVHARSGGRYAKLARTLFEGHYDGT